MHFWDHARSEFLSAGKKRVMPIVKILFVQPFGSIDDVNFVAVAQPGDEVFYLSASFGTIEIAKLLRDRHEDKGDGNVLTAAAGDQIVNRLSRFGRQLEMLETLGIHVVGPHPTEGTKLHRVGHITEQTPAPGVDRPPRLIEFGFFWRLRMTSQKMFVDIPPKTVPRRQTRLQPFGNHFPPIGVIVLQKEEFMGAEPGNQREMLFRLKAAPRAMEECRDQLDKQQTRAGAFGEKVIQVHGMVNAPRRRQPQVESQDWPAIGGRLAGQSSGLER